jgi:membrane protein involved in colicin uptake
MRMNRMKITIVCAVAVAALVTDFMQFQTIKAFRQENEALKQQAAQVASLQEQLARATQEAAQAATSQEPQVRDLARLRGEVSRLRAQTNELAKAQQEIQALKQREASEVEARRGEAEARRSQAAASQAEIQQKQNVDSCVNNLRLIDAAKQQWALENKKQATDTPGMDDLRPYIGRGVNGELPTCPDGGTYTIGAVGEKPTCSNAAHVLP